MSETYLVMSKVDEKRLKVNGIVCTASSWLVYFLLKNTCDLLGTPTLSIPNCCRPLILWPCTCFSLLSMNVALDYSPQAVLPCQLLPPSQLLVPSQPFVSCPLLSPFPQSRMLTRSSTRCSSFSTHEHIAFSRPSTCSRTGPCAPSPLSRLSKRYPFLWLSQPSTESALTISL